MMPHVLSQVTSYCTSPFQCALQLVIQLAKAKGIHTCNVVRDRPNMPELEHYLKSLGADVVTTDDKLKEALGDFQSCIMVTSPCVYKL